MRRLPPRVTRDKSALGSKSIASISFLTLLLSSSIGFSLDIRIETLAPPVLSDSEYPITIAVSNHPDWLGCCTASSLYVTVVLDNATVATVPPTVHFDAITATPSSSVILSASLPFPPNQIKWIPLLVRTPSALSSFVVHASLTAFEQGSSDPRTFTGQPTTITPFARSGVSLATAATDFAERRLDYAGLLREFYRSFVATGNPLDPLAGGALDGRLDAVRQQIELARRAESVGTVLELAASGIEYGLDPDDVVAVGENIGDVLVDRWADFLGIDLVSVFARFLGFVDRCILDAPRIGEQCLTPVPCYEFCSSFGLRYLLDDYIDLLTTETSAWRQQESVILATLDQETQVLSELNLWCASKRALISSQLTVARGVVEMIAGFVDGEMELHGLGAGPRASLTQLAMYSHDLDGDSRTELDNDCNDNDPLIYWQAPETCNNTDDDCDGLTDEGFACECTTGSIRPCGTDVGECRAGVQRCYNTAWGVCEDAYDGAPEACPPDGKDNDCDGMIDDLNCDGSTYNFESGLDRNINLTSSDQNCPDCYEWIRSVSVSAYGSNFWNIDDVDGDGCEERYLTTGEPLRTWFRCRSQSSLRGPRVTDFFDNPSNIAGTRRGCNQGGGNKPYSFSSSFCDTDVEYSFVDRFPAGPTDTLYSDVRYCYVEGTDGSWAWYGLGSFRLMNSCPDGHSEPYYILECGVDRDCPWNQYCSKATPSDPTSYRCRPLCGNGRCDPGEVCPSDGRGSEACNVADDDCDGATDEGLAVICTGDADCGADGCFDGSYRDFRCDQPGTCASTCQYSTRSTDVDGDGSDIECDHDCDDSDASTFPGAPELCDGIDTDCDGTADDFVTACGIGECHATGRCVAGGDDCIPGPASREICDLLDNDCDGTTDEGGLCTFDVQGFLGRLEVSACQQGTHVLVDPCTGQRTEVLSLQVDLEQYLCGHVEVRGRDVGVTCPVLDAQQVQSLVPPCTLCDTGMVGVCSSGEWRCDLLDGQIACEPVIKPSAETCDGLDNDCDGTIDDFATSCGFGACASIGICIAGHDSCTPGTPVAETCNNIDDDCDGTVDAFGTTCGIGACASTGTCVTAVDSCTPGTEAPDDALCNGIDDDCDSETDEEFSSEPTSCGLGACTSMGLTSCVGGVLGDSCTPGTPVAETCNSIDDDCDGSVDGFATTCGVGACRSTSSCMAGVDSCTERTPAPDDSVCNGADDDCDGATDEEFASTPTTCGFGACASTGGTECVGGVVNDTCIPGTPAPNDATCNGVDDDCDGATDEDFISSPTTCGLGICAASGLTSCVAGQLLDSCAPGQPGTEVCDGVDNDCDGFTDEGNVPGGSTCPIRAQGFVGRLAGVSVCQQGTHVLTDPCSGGSILLQSSTINLDQVVCQHVEVTGPDVGVECRVIEVEQLLFLPTPCTACSTGRPGVCANGHVFCSVQAGGVSCEPDTVPSTETCDGLDNDCDGTTDGFATTCGVGACASTGTCTAGVDSCTPGSPSAEVCDGLDNDCNGFVDGPDFDSDGLGAVCDNCPAAYNPGQENSDGNPDGGDACDMAIYIPLSGAGLCGGAPPTIRWTTEAYNRFRVFVSWDPGFKDSRTYTSGDLKVPSWTPPAGKWSRGCRNANPNLHIKVRGKVAGKEQPKEFSDIVTLKVK